MNVQHGVNCNDARRAGVLDPNIPSPRISSLCAAGFGWNRRAVLIEWKKPDLRMILLRNNAIV